MYTDFHCHVLPQYCDSLEELQISQKMLQCLKNQGIAKVIATPHYYNHSDSIESFLFRRYKNLCAINHRIDNESLPSIVPGAEVHIEHELSLVNYLDMLCIANTNVMLLELPYCSFENWMLEEIYNIMYKFSIIPMIAHIDRYMGWYGEDQMQKIMSIPEAIYQINNEAFFHLKTRKKLLRLIQEGFPVVLGSDAHDISSRAPNYDRSMRILQRKLAGNYYERLISFGNSFL